jgi:UDP-N-acetylmuramate-alanine ligase
LALINECTKFSWPATRSSKLLEEFKGLWRRMELLWKNKNGAKIYTDYGHMASSIAWGYEALKQKYPDYKLCVIFQPHQINRILLGRNDFIKAIRPYDKVIIYDIYAARENVTELIKKFQSTHAWFKETINLQELWTIFAQECWWKYVKNREDVKKEIELTDSKTIIVVFSAGDIDYHLRSLDFIV